MPGCAALCFSRRRSLAPVLVELLDETEVRRLGVPFGLVVEEVVLGTGVDVAEEFQGCIVEDAAGSEGRLGEFAVVGHGRDGWLVAVRGRQSWLLAMLIAIVQALIRPMADSSAW